MRDEFAHFFVPMFVRRRGFSTASTFDVRGGPLAGRPLDGVVRRATLSKEMTGTRGRRRSDWAVRWQRGRAKAPEDLWHFGSCNLDQLASHGKPFAFWFPAIQSVGSSGCLYFRPGRQASQRFRGSGLRASTVRLTDAWLFLGCQMLQHGRPPRKRTWLQQDSATTRRHFWCCLTNKLSRPR